MLSRDQNLEHHSFPLRLSLLVHINCLAFALWKHSMDELVVGQYSRGCCKVSASTKGLLSLNVCIKLPGTFHLLISVLHTVFAIANILFFFKPHMLKKERKMHTNVLTFWSVPDGSVAGFGTVWVHLTFLRELRGNQAYLHVWETAQS